MMLLRQIGVALLTALVFGMGLTWVALENGRLFGAVSVGPWRAWTNVGLPHPDPYTRAYIAETGALNLGSSEGLQFIATTDSANRTLDRGCRYRVTGLTPPARFWTLMPAAALDAGPVTPKGAPTHLVSTGLARDAKGRINIALSRTLAGGDWLELEGPGAFTLVLTLYDPSSFSTLGSDEAELPRITREAC
jgi:hypothetical protein